MKVAIIINEKRATDTLKEELKTQYLSEKYNLSYDVFFSKPEELESLLQNINHQSYNAFIIGGGDGTVRTAAHVLADKNVPLAFLPLGTFNLLAKTLNYPNNLETILGIIKNNKTKLIDLAEVNGNTFINHVWIGFYYYILKLREKHKNVLGKNKLLKILFTAFNLFKHLPIYQLTLTTDDQTVCYKTCLVYIANNESSANIFDIGEHRSLTSGLLSVTILNCHSRWSLFKCIISLTIKSFKNSKYITQFSTPNLTITTKNDYINLVVDGEFMKLNTPLNFVSHQKKLMVFVP